MAKLSQFSANEKSSTNFNGSKTQKVSEEEIKEKFETYKGMSREELNSQLFSEVARQKMQGTFDYEALAKMVESIKGSLSTEQYANIVRLLESLK